MGKAVRDRDIWVFVEQHQGEPCSVSLELLGKARQLADKTCWQVVAILAGRDVESLSPVLITSGADLVYLLEHPVLEYYRSDLYPPVIARLIQKYRPAVMLFGASAAGRDLAPSVAALVKTGCAADCCDMELEADGGLLQIVPAFGSQMMATIVTPAHRPQIATVRPGGFSRPAPGSREGRTERIPVELPAGEIRLADAVWEQMQPSSLAAARIVVAGGAGVGSREGWDLLHELADVLRGSLGGSRPALDAGWIEENQMIGQSGCTIRPDLYIAVGISGDIQHMVGVREAKVIVAINNNPLSPVFRQSDYGIVGDYREVVTVLLKSLKRLSKESILGKKKPSYKGF